MHLQAPLARRIGSMTGVRHAAHCVGLFDMYRPLERTLLIRAGGDDLRHGKWQKSRYEYGGASVRSLRVAAASNTGAPASIALWMRRWFWLLSSSVAPPEPCRHTILVGCPDILRRVFSNK
jgi:hypothetical protein